MALDTPEEIEALRNARKRYREKLPVLMHVGINGKQYRIRELNAIKGIGHVTADVLYKENWIPVKNYAVLTQLREFIETGSTNK